MSPTRALNTADKQQKREDIIDAAEQLWLQNPDEIANMASVAKAAKVAKGTLYLYFSSKEALFLAIHERHVTTFFDHVITRATQQPAMQFGDMSKLVRRFIVATPAFLPLATLAHSFMERQLPLDTSFEFQERCYAHLDRVVDALKPHYPMVTQSLMLQSYALIIGLWQLLRPSPLKELMKQRELLCACTDDYINALDQALTTLWQGAALHMQLEDSP